MSDIITVDIEGDDNFEFEVVGESHYQQNLEEICGGKTREGHEFYCKAILQHEPHNPHDSNAVAVYINDLKVAHVPSAVSARVASSLQGHRARVDAVVVGGWDRGDGDTGSFGVYLDI